MFVGIENGWDAEIVAEARAFFAAEPDAERFSVRRERFVKLIPR